MKHTLWVDIETFGVLDLKKVGSYRYLRDVGTFPLLFQYAIDDGPVRYIDHSEQEVIELPEDLVALLESEDVLVVSHGSFDRIGIAALYGIEVPVRRWRCTMALAMSANLPPSLDALCKAVGLPQEERKLSGKKLIARFCKPAPSNHKAYRYDKNTHPEEWAAFVDYGVRDVAAMRAAAAKIPKVNYSGRELRLWQLDQKINDRGIRIDTDLAQTCYELGLELTDKINKRMSDVTRGEVTKTTQVQQLKAWIAERGVETDSLDAATIEELIEDGGLEPEVEEALELRALGNKSSVSKYRTAMIAVDPDDDRMRGTLAAFAARTLRWGGRLIQPQNMPRQNTTDPAIFLEALYQHRVDEIYDQSAMKALSEAIRGLIIPAPGMRLIWSDLSGIEARMLPWLADDDDGLEVFRRGEDPYKRAAMGIYHCEYDEVTKAQRFVGKVAVLALGYQGGWRAFVRMAKNYGAKISRAEAEVIVENWRNANPKIRSFWRELDNTCRAAIENPGNTYHCRKLIISANKSALRIKLPSGHIIYYHRPRIGDLVLPKGKGIIKDTICFWGVHSASGRWMELSTYGGSIAENVTQAAARDLLAARMPHMEAAGYSLILTIHDEVVAEVPLHSDHSPERLSDILAVNEPWCLDLPLKAEGKEGIYFRK